MFNSSASTGPWLLFLDRHATLDTTHRQRQGQRENPTPPTEDVGNESMRVNSQLPDEVNDRDLMMVICMATETQSYCN